MGHGGVAAAGPRLVAGGAAAAEVAGAVASVGSARPQRDPRQGRFQTVGVGAGARRRGDRRCRTGRRAAAEGGAAACRPVLVVAVSARAGDRGARARCAAAASGTHRTRPLRHRRPDRTLHAEGRCGAVRAGVVRALQPAGAQRLVALRRPACRARAHSRGAAPRPAVPVEPAGAGRREGRAAAGFQAERRGLRQRRVGHAVRADARR